MLTEKTFAELIEKTGGFEAVLGFRDNVDHMIGGSGGKIWYFVQKGAKEEFYVREPDGTETRFTRTKKALKSAPAPAGKTMSLVLAELAAGQREIETSGRKPVKVEFCGLGCSHYVFAFGERAYKVADEYGITVERSELNDPDAGFRLRTVVLGKDVIAPPES